MNNPKKLPEETTPPEEIGKLKVRVEEGLTRDKPSPDELTEEELDSISGGLAKLPISKLRPE